MSDDESRPLLLVNGPGSRYDGRSEYEDDLHPGEYEEFSSVSEDEMLDTYQRPRRRRNTHDGSLRRRSEPAGRSEDVDIIDVDLQTPTGVLSDPDPRDTLVDIDHPHLRRRRKNSKQDEKLFHQARRRRDRKKHIPRVPGVPFLPARRRAVRRMHPPGFSQPYMGFTDENVPMSDRETEVSLIEKRTVTAYCIAQAFEWEDLCTQINELAHSHALLNDEVVHFRAENWPVTADAFAFATYGTVVFWSLEEPLQDSFLKALKHEIDEETLLGAEEEKDSFDYFHDLRADEVKFRIFQNMFVLPRTHTKRQDILNRLAVSYGLATSTKLDTFEVGIERTIEATQYLPEELASTGRMKLKKDEISRYIGELYIQKSSVNLVHDILDAPDWFWDQDELESIYMKCRRMLNIDQRVEVLNKRLDVLAELLDILRTEKSEQHSTRLELIVIWLIVVEIVIGFFDIFYNMFGSHGHPSPV